MKAFGDNWKVLCQHDKGNARINYMYDKDTEIVYIYKHAGDHAALSVYYNSKGEPMTKKEFENVHMNKYHED